MVRRRPRRLAYFNNDGGGNAVRNARTLRGSSARDPLDARRRRAGPTLASRTTRNDEEVEMHSENDRIVHDTGDDAPVIRDVQAEAEAG